MWLFTWEYLISGFILKYRIQWSYLDMEHKVWLGRRYGSGRQDGASTRTRGLSGIEYSNQRLSRLTLAFTKCLLSHKGIRVIRNEMYTKKGKEMNSLVNTTSSSMFAKCWASVADDGSIFTTVLWWQNGLPMLYVLLQQCSYI